MANMSSSILGSISRKIAPKSLPFGRRKFCSAIHELLQPAAAAAPCLMLPPTFTMSRQEGYDYDMAYNFFSLTKGKVVTSTNRGGQQQSDLMRDRYTTLVGSSHGWFATFNSHTCDLSLINPLSGRRIPLPPLPAEKQRLPPWKVILSCSPADERNCRALLIPGKCDRPAICRPGRSRGWAPFDTYSIILPGRLYVDFVYSASRARFFGLVQSGRWLDEELEGWEVDIHNDDDSSLCRAMDRWHRFTRPHFVNDTNTNTNTNTNTTSRVAIPDRYLVHDEKSGQLFLVRRYAFFREKVGFDVATRSLLVYDEDKIDYDVFRIDDGGGVELCSSLDDLAMFVGINHSFAVKASEYPGLKPNCIYFSDARESKNDSSSQTIEIFDYQSKSSSPFYYTSRHLSNRYPIPWFTPTSD